MGFVIERKLVEDVELIPCLACIGLGSKTKVLEIFAHEIEIVSYAEDRHCEGHYTRKSGLWPKGVINIGKSRQNDKCNSCFESKCKMRSHGVIAIDDS